MDHMVYMEDAQSFQRSQCLGIGALLFFTHFAAKCSSGAGRCVVRLRVASVSLNIDLVLGTAAAVKCASGRACGGEGWRAVGRPVARAAKRSFSALLVLTRRCLRPAHADTNRSRCLRSLAL